jgi:hypothetical protein
MGLDVRWTLDRCLPDGPSCQSSLNVQDNAHSFTDNYNLLVEVLSEGQCEDICSSLKIPVSILRQHAIALHAMSRCSTHKPNRKSNKSP